MHFVKVWWENLPYAIPFLIIVIGAAVINQPWKKEKDNDEY